MKKMTVAVLLVVIALFAAAPAFAAMDCSDMQPTTSSLVDCVHHAADNGYIYNAGVAQSLLAKATAAQTAEAGGQPGVAANILQAFVKEIQALPAGQIDPAHADHMIMHAQMVIEALGG